MNFLNLDNACEAKLCNVMVISIPEKFYLQLTMQLDQNVALVYLYSVQMLWT